MEYNHDDNECFCQMCGNNSLDNSINEMCELCYDDNSLVYFCYLCQNYYNCNDINNICVKYIYSANVIKKNIKNWISLKKKKRTIYYILNEN